MNEDLSEMITYSTALITVTKKTGNSSTGTGFFMLLHRTEGWVPVLITNRHLIANSYSYSFKTCLHEGDNIPLDKETVTVSGESKEWIMHPDPKIDLCCLPVGGLIMAPLGSDKYPFFRTFSTELIPTARDVDGFSAIEDIYMVGYPTGFFDNYNNKPIFRKGITATHMKFDYCGEREFLIDCPCFPGSSGSPVFILNRGPHYDKNTQGISIGGTRFFLVGVQYKTYLADPIKVEQTSTQENQSVLKIPNNLGFVIKSELIKDFESVIFNGDFRN